MKETIDRIKDMFDENSSLGSNLAHLQHTFEGYRDFILQGNDADCPYSPGSARERSWSIGRKIAKEDLDNRSAVSEVDSRTVLVKVFARIGAGKTTVAHLIKQTLVKAGFPEVMLEDFDDPAHLDFMEEKIDALAKRSTRVHIRTVQLRRPVQRNGPSS